MKALSLGTTIALGLLTSSVLIYQNCAPAKFSMNNYDANNGQLGDVVNPIATCTVTDGVTVPLRILMAVDNTGSNGSNKYSEQLPSSGFTYGLGSDNDQYFRQKSAADLLSSLSGLSNITYNLMVFQDLATVGWRPSQQKNGPNVRSLINIGGNDQLPTFGDATTMGYALQDLQKLQQDGPTEYFTVISLLKKAITSDHELASGKQNYAIVFMTDGQPTERIIDDPTSPTGKTTRDWNGAQDEADLIQAIKDLVAVSNGHITFNTVFYNNLTEAQRQQLITPTYDPVDPNAPGLLKKMADAGQGQFANANVEGADHVKLSNVISLPSEVCK